MKEVHTLRMAKAPQSDIDAVRQFLQTLEEKMICEETSDEDLVHWLAQAYTEIDGLWERILFGYETLVANACDPSLTYLDYKPEIKQAMAQHLANKSDPV